MRLKDGEFKFSGDTTEGRDDYIDNYWQVTQSYRLLEGKKFQFLLNVLSKDFKRFYNATVAPLVDTFQ